LNCNITWFMQITGASKLKEKNSSKYEDKEEDLMYLHTNRTYDICYVIEYLINTNISGHLICLYCYQVVIIFFTRLHGAVPQPMF
jgi:hypothetical protein